MLSVVVREGAGIYGACESRLRSGVGARGRGTWDAWDREEP